jgi:thiamine biosynthesis lipoprotein
MRNPLKYQKPEWDCLLPESSSGQASAWVTKFLASLLSILILLTLLSGCGIDQTPESVSETRFLLNTVCILTIHSLADQSSSLSDMTTKQAILADAFDLISRYEALFSVTIEGSDIWRINHANAEEVPVSPPTIDILNQSLYFSELSDGMFDVTIGQLTSLWNSSDDLSYIENALPALRETVDYRQIELFENTVRLNNPQARIDLGGIAKGFIADRVAEFFIENGVESAIINLGGDIVTLGTAPESRLWRIAVREPFGSAEDRDFFGIINIGMGAVVSSGIYERFFELDGVIYHHIIDPFTGFPANTDVVGATVVAENTITGDVLASIIVLIGSEKAEVLLNQASGFIGAILILDNDDYIIIGDFEFEIHN